MVLLTAPVPVIDGGTDLPGADPNSPLPPTHFSRLQSRLDAPRMETSLHQDRLQVADPECSTETAVAALG